MTLAQLLRRSAEYARRSVEELARALSPPARHGAPSLEPAYAPRNRGFRPKGFGKRCFHWSGYREARRRQCTERQFFEHMSRRGSKFFRANYNGGFPFHHHHYQYHQHCVFHHGFHRGVHRWLRRAARATRLTLWCALRRPAQSVVRPSQALVMPNLILRAGVSRLQLSQHYGHPWPMWFSAVYGPRLTPASSPYAVLRENITGARSFSTLREHALLRYQDQFRTKHAVGMEIREKLRGLATYQQTASNLVLPRAVPPAAEAFSAAARESELTLRECRAGDGGHDDLSASAPALSAAVDFSLAPRLGLPVVGELNEGMIDAIHGAVRSQIANLQAVLADVDRIAELGELPISVEQNGTVLRVHLPNCDAERASVLVDDKEVTHGRTIEIVAPRICVPGTDEVSSDSSASVALSSDVSSETSDEVWEHVRNDTPELTSMESSQSHSSPSLLTLN